MHSFQRLTTHPREIFFISKITSWLSSMYYCVVFVMNDITSKPYYNLLGKNVFKRHLSHGHEDTGCFGARLSV